VGRLPLFGVHWEPPSLIVFVLGSFASNSPVKAGDGDTEYPDYATILCLLVE
jgi:hypothetical protein